MHSTHGRKWNKDFGQDERYARAHLGDRMREVYKRAHNIRNWEMADSELQKYDFDKLVRMCPIEISDADLIKRVETHIKKERKEYLKQFERPMGYSVPKPIKHLYVIGNGFDLYHGAKCTYRDFYEYLKRRASHVAAAFDLFFGNKSLLRSFVVPSDYIMADAFIEFKGCKVPLDLYPKPTWSVKNLWCSFEEHLSHFNREKVLELLDRKLPTKDEGDDDFSYSSYYMPFDVYRSVLYSLTDEMKYRLHRWINTLGYEKGHRKRLVKLDSNAVFLNFNYTTFLEDTYGIKHENINYIHGCRKDKLGSLIIGHSHKDDVQDFYDWMERNKNKWKYRPNIKSRNGRYYANDRLPYLAFFLEDETKGNWRLTTRYYAIEQIENIIEGYYKANYKDTQSTIDKNVSFFKSLEDIERVTVLGHSLSDVDLPYFQEIVRNNKSPKNIQWEFSYYSDKDLENINRFCKRMRVSCSEKVPPFKMSEIV